MQEGDAGACLGSLAGEPSQERAKALIRARDAGMGGPRRTGVEGERALAGNQGATGPFTGRPLSASPFSRSPKGTRDGPDAPGRPAKG
jgi:hypothetical protein